MAFLKKQRPLPKVYFCRIPLPWVEKIKHLGNSIANVIVGGQLDFKTKIARYIEKNSNLC